jgi:hypothetical protein
MATRAFANSELGVRSIETVWTGLLNGDDGTPVEFFDLPEKTVSITGTFGSGGTIVIEGSNDGTNYFTLTDLQSTAISKTAAALEAIAENPRYIRPRVTAGDGTTALVCRMLSTGWRR